MFTSEAFREFAQELAELNGLPLDVALRYASLIGDTPVMDEDGLVVVRTESDEILARVKMSDEFDKYFQCVETAQGWEYQVGIVRWPRPHTPIMRWTTVQHWPSQPDAASIAAIRTTALGNPGFFRSCSRCGERKNAGHMHDTDICSACAERYLGVRY